MTVQSIAANGSPGAIANLPYSPNLQFQRSGICFTSKVSVEVWEHVGRHLLTVADSATWWIADWLAYGESKFPGRYEEAIKRTSLNYQTLRNYTWVARQFDLPRRHDSLSFAHHAEVAALAHPEQDYWLRTAEANAWSRNRLRSEVRKSLEMRRDQAGGDAEGDEASVVIMPSAEASAPTPNEVLSVELTSNELAHCRMAAKAQQYRVEEWARLAMLNAAQRNGLHSSRANDA